MKDDRAQFVLRELPGVAELEALLEKIEEHPNPEWSPDRDHLPKMVDRISLALFGIARRDTEFREQEDGEDADQYERGWGAWEDQFWAPWSEDADEQWELEKKAWSALGWDVADADGEYLYAIEYLKRQIVCATNGLCGRLPGTPMTDEQAKTAAEDWGAKLAKEASQRPRSRP